MGLQSQYRPEWKPQMPPINGQEIPLHSSNITPQKESEIREANRVSPFQATRNFPSQQTGGISTGITGSQSAGLVFKPTSSPGHLTDNKQKLETAPFSQSSFNSSFNDLRIKEDPPSETNQTSSPIVDQTQNLARNPVQYQIPNSSQVQNLNRTLQSQAPNPVQSQVPNQIPSQNWNQPPPRPTMQNLSNIQNPHNLPSQSNILNQSRNLQSQTNFQSQLNLQNQANLQNQTNLQSHSNIQNSQNLAPNYNQTGFDNRNTQSFPNSNQIGQLSRTMPRIPSQNVDNTNSMSNQQDHGNVTQNFFSSSQKGGTGQNSTILTRPQTINQTKPDANLRYPSVNQYGNLPPLQNNPKIGNLPNTSTVQHAMITQSVQNAQQNMPPNFCPPMQNLPSQNKYPTQNYMYGTQLSNTNLAGPSLINPRPPVSGLHVPTMQTRMPFQGMPPTIPMQPVSLCFSN